MATKRERQTTSIRLENISPQTIYSYTVQKLEKRVKKYKALLKTKKDIETSLQKETKPVMARVFKARLKQIDSDIKKKHPRELENYKQIVQPLLQKYSDDGDVYYDFVSDEQVGNTDYKIKITKDIFHISGRFVKLEFNVIQKLEHICPCGANLLNVKVSISGKLKCPVCKAVTFHTQKASQSKMSSVDSAIDNVKKDLACFQGKDVGSVPESVIDYIRNSPGFVDVKGYTDQSNHKKLRTLLSRCGLTAYDPHIHLIGHKLWGWKLENISDIEGAFIDIFIKIYKGYLSLEKDRKSSFGLDYVKPQIFWMLGRKYPSDWFKTISNIDGLEACEDLWRRSCEKCDDPRIVYRSIRSI